MARAREEQSASTTSRATSIDLLRALLAYCDEEGVSAAARRLGVSQPVVSRKLDSLTKPEACGAILLRRTDVGLQLTEAGRSTLPAVRELVRRYDQLSDYWNGVRSGMESVSIAVGHFMAEHLLPHALAAARGKQSDFEFTTHVVRGNERILGTYDGRYDLAIISHDAAQVASLLRRDRGSGAVLHLTRLPAPALVVIAAKNRPDGRQLAETHSGRPIPLSRLVAFELVGLDAFSGVRRQLEERLRKLHPSSQLTFSTEGGGWTAAREFARQGLGVAIVPQPILKHADSRDFVIRRLSRDFQLVEFVARRYDASQAVRDFESSLVRVASKELGSAANARKA